MENLLNYARRSLLVLMVVPRYMAQVFGWLYKGGSLDLENFLQQQDAMKYFKSFEAVKIKAKTDPANMDITLLYKVLVYSCDIPSEKPERGTNVKKKSTLMQVLSRLKQIRNETSHKDPEKLTWVSDNDLDALANELTQLLTQMLTLAGRAGGQRESAIADVISNMEADVARGRRADDGITVEQFVILGRQELMKMATPEYCYVEPRLVVKTRDASFGSIIPLSELFSRTFRDGSQLEVIQVTGEAGAGKTSLCQALLAWWLRKDSRAAAVLGYQLVLSVTCSSVKSSDLHRHLRTWTLPETTASCDAASLTRLLRQAKILWLVDGWDEATREARCLLQELLHSRGESHTVLATCRPELGASLAQHLGKNVFNVSFARLQDTERNALIRGMNLPGAVHKSLEMFLNHMRSYSFEQQQDLNTPLKLRLLAQLWCLEQGVDGRPRPLSLARIYLYTVDWQRRDLIARCQADAAPGQDVTQMVDAWLRRLYELSFNSAKSTPSLILDSKSLKTLSKVCGVPTSLCLSTFLGCTANVMASCHSSVSTFSHDSQRCVYAARHLECCCEGAADAEATLREVLEADFNKLDDHVDPHLGVYDLVVQLLLVLRILLSIFTFGLVCHEARRKHLKEATSHLWRKFVHLVKGVHLPSDKWIQESFKRSRLVPVLLQVIEMWADDLFQARVSAKFLVDMFASLLEGDTDPGRWLEVVRRSGINNDLVKEASRKVSTRLWVINDCDVRAAASLLQHVTPAEVSVVVSSDPRRLPHLYELLSKLAACSVVLQLHILSHFHVLGSKDFSDTYLELVCRRESQCQLTTFTGNLSVRGLHTLAEAPRLESLTLRITQPLAVNELTALTPQLLYLKTLNLVYDNRKFVAPHSSLDGSLGVVMVNGIRSILTLNGLRSLAIHLQLPHVRETSVNAAVEFISRLSKRYVSLSVGKIEQRGVRSLVAGLRNSAVSVGDFRIPVYVKEYGGNILFGLGSLPIQVPVGDFLRHLHNLFRDPFANVLLKRL